MQIPNAPTEQRVLKTLGADLREIVVIALGILSAFAIDAWWGELQEDRDVRQALVAVKAETTLDLAAGFMESLGASGTTTDPGFVEPTWVEPGTDPTQWSRPVELAAHLGKVAGVE